MAKTVKHSGVDEIISNQNNTLVIDDAVTAILQTQANVNSFQSQQTQITNLQNQVAALESRINVLEAN